VRTLVLPGVLRPPSDARLLVDSLRDRELARGASVLDVFTGSGVLAVAAALHGARSVLATDISRRAVLNVRINARLNGVRVRSRRGDLFAPVPGERFDLVIANPPYLPSARRELPRHGAARAWEGGRTGRLLVDRFCAEVHSHLAPGGSAMLVHSSLCGEQATLEALRGAGMQAEVLARSRGPLGPIALARTDLLEQIGALRPGERAEEMLVIQALASINRQPSAATAT
jgi:release factor glutamine methyltransferase